MEADGENGGRGLRKIETKFPEFILQIKRSPSEIRASFHLFKNRLVIMFGAREITILSHFQLPCHPPISALPPANPGPARKIPTGNPHPSPLPKGRGSFRMELDSAETIDMRKGVGIKSKKWELFSHRGHRDHRATNRLLIYPSPPSPKEREG
jgi:hypothetical protein